MLNLKRLNTSNNQKDPQTSSLTHIFSSMNKKVLYHTYRISKIVVCSITNRGYHLPFVYTVR